MRHVQSMLTSRANYTRVLTISGPTYARTERNMFRTKHGAVPAAGGYVDASVTDTVKQR